MKGRWVNHRFYTIPKGKGTWERTKYKRSYKPDGYYTDAMPARYANFAYSQQAGPVGESYTSEYQYNARKLVSTAGSVYSYRGRWPEPDANGWLPVNDFLVERGNVKASGQFDVTGINALGTTRYRLSGRGWMAMNTKIWPASLPSLHTDEMNVLIAEAKQKAYAAAAKAKFDSAVELAELDEAVGQLMKAAPRHIGNIRAFLRERSKLSKAKKSGNKRLLKRYADSKKERQRKNPPKPTNKLAENWLTWRYGILPMILSYEDLLEYLKDPKKQRRTASGSVRRKTKEYSYVTHTLWDARYVFKVTTTYEQWASTKLFLAGVTDPHAMGFGAYDLLRAAWERTPYSFAADWFLNIGLALDSHRPVKVNVCHQSNTYCSKVTRVVKLHKKEKITSSIHSSSKVSFELKSKRFFMTRNGVVDLPTLPVFSMKSWIPERKLDALALLWLKARR
jgi:hypothetical protein